MIALEKNAEIGALSKAGKNLMSAVNYLTEPSTNVIVTNSRKSYGASPDMFIKRLQDYYDSLDGLFTNRA